MMPNFNQKSEFNQDYTKESLKEPSNEPSLFSNHLIAVGKARYAKGIRPNVSCIFCAVRDNSPDVISLKIYYDEMFMICLNLYPYNPGHLMVIPNKHIETFEDLTSLERNRMFELTIACQKMLKEIYEPSGFNVGYNEGSYSGASIKHIHTHIVPRYKTELGFMDIISTTKIILQPVSEVFQTLKSNIHKFISPLTVLDG